MLRNKFRFIPGCAGARRYPHDRKTATDVLTRRTGNHTSTMLDWIVRKLSRSRGGHQEKKTYVMAPQFPIIVATVESNLVRPLVSCR